jgi:hypothetical protein
MMNPRPYVHVCGQLTKVIQPTSVCHVWKIAGVSASSSVVWERLSLEPHMCGGENSTTCVQAQLRYQNGCDALTKERQLVNVTCREREERCNEETCSNKRNVWEDSQMDGWTKVIKNRWGEEWREIKDEQNSKGICYNRRVTGHKKNKLNVRISRLNCDN